MTEALKFNLALDAEFEELLSVGVHGKIRKIALSALTKVVLRSPVDTGRFRGNWFVSTGIASGTVTQDADPTGQETLSRGSAVIATYPTSGFPVIYLSNNLDYASVLEGGTSRQAPSGVVGITVAELAAEWEKMKL